MLIKKKHTSTDHCAPFTLPTQSAHGRKPAPPSPARHKWPLRAPWHGRNPHTHVAAAPHLWVKEASKEHNTGMEGQREIYTHTHTQHI